MRFSRCTLYITFAETVFRYVTCHITIVTLSSGYVYAFVHAVYVVENKLTVLRLPHKNRRSFLCGTTDDWEEIQRVSHVEAINPFQNINGMTRYLARIIAKWYGV